MSDTDAIATNVGSDSSVEPQNRLDPWLVPPHTAQRRSRSCGGDRKGTVMTRPLVELVEQFCQYQLKQRGRTEGGVQTARWSLEQFLLFVRDRSAKIATLLDLDRATIQEWMDDMAARDLSVSSMRTRQSTLSSFCTWLVKREVLQANPVAGMDRPPHKIEAPKQVPTPSLMDVLIEAARKQQRPRDVAIFLIMRFTGMRRASVATLQARHLDGLWGLRRVRVKGGRTRDIPLPEPVMRYLHSYVEQIVAPSVTRLMPETPIFWSVWGRRSIGMHRAPMTGKNIWRLCKLYGRLIGYPMLKPHDIRHGVAMEVLEQRHDLEQVRALLGHQRIDTTQIYTMIRPAQLKQAVSFYEEPARRMLENVGSVRKSMFEEHVNVPQTRSEIS
jgi:integrase/recombinase XerC